MRTTWLGLVGDGFSGRRNYDKPADEHLPADRVGTSVDKYGKVSSIGFPWRPIVAILNIQLRARSSVSLRSGGSILLSKAGPFLASGEDNMWFFALNYAAAHHLVIGQDIAWTGGPLFYLLFPFDIGHNLARGLAFQAASWVLVIVVLWDLFFRGGFPVRNLAVFSVLIGLSTLEYHQMGYPGNLLLYPALMLLVHFRLRGGIVRYVTALAIMGLMPLLQIFGVLVAAGVMAGLIVDFLLRDRRTASPCRSSSSEAWGNLPIDKIVK